MDGPAPPPASTGALTNTERDELERLRTSYSCLLTCKKEQEQELKELEKKNQRGPDDGEDEPSGKRTRYDTMEEERHAFTTEQKRLEQELQTKTQAVQKLEARVADVDTRLAKETEALKRTKGELTKAQAVATKAAKTNQELRKSNQEAMKSNQ